MQIRILSRKGSAKEEESCSKQTTIVMSHLLEPGEGWEALDFESFGEGLLFGGVDLGNGEGRVLCLQHLSGGFVLGGELLAVAARHQKR